MTDRYPLVPKDYRIKIRSTAHLDFYFCYDMTNQQKYAKIRVFLLMQSAPDWNRTSDVSLRSLGKRFALRDLHLHAMSALPADTRFFNNHFACAAKHP